MRERDANYRGQSAEQKHWQTPAAREARKQHLHNKRKATMAKHPRCANAIAATADPHKPATTYTFTT